MSVMHQQFYGLDLMGKMGSSSWLTTVKRAFRSPTKDADKRTTRRRKEKNDQEEDDDKKKKKMDFQEDGESRND